VQERERAHVREKRTDSEYVFLCAEKSSLHARTNMNRQKKAVSRKGMRVCRTNARAHAYAHAYTDRDTDTQTHRHTDTCIWSARLTLQHTCSTLHGTTCRVEFDASTGWRRPIGCLQLQVIFRKRATNYKALLRKMTYEDKAPYDFTPPCTPVHVRHDSFTSAS